MILRGNEYNIFFFVLKYPTYILNEARTMEEEKIIKYPLRYFGNTCTEFVPNLSWIVPLALYTDDNYKTIEVMEAGS